MPNPILITVYTLDDKDIKSEYGMLDNKQVDKNYIKELQIICLVNIQGLFFV